MAGFDRTGQAERVRRLSPFMAGVLVVICLGTLRETVQGPFESLQHYVFDELQRLFPRADAELTKPGSGVIVVDIDEASLARYGQWPWSRLLVARLIGTLQDAGAKAIGLDLILAEADRTSPSVLAPEWQRSHGLAVTPATPGAPLPDYDAQLAQTIGRGRVVMGFGLVQDPNGKTFAPTSGIALLGSGAGQNLSNFFGATPNLPALDDAAAGQGSLSVSAPGYDEVVRQLPLVMMFDGTLVPSLSLDVLRVATDPDSNLRLRQERNGGPDGTLMGYTVAVDDLTIPLTANGALWMRYGDRPAGRTLSATQILAPDAHSWLTRAIGGRIVLVGTSAVGLSDLRPTPLSAFEPGVNIHAAAIEQVLGGDFLRRPAIAPGAEAVLAAALALAIAAAVTRFGVRAGTVTAGAAIAASILATGWGFTRDALLFDPSLVVLGSVAAFTASMLARYLVAQRRSNALRSAFGHYLSPHLVESLARDPDRLRLGGEEREMTFLFTDLEGFTTFTESSDPALLVKTLNAYLDGVCEIAMDHGGTVDKIVGDAVHLMFNAPTDQPDHAARAVRCAIAIDRFSSAFASRHKETLPDRPPFGVTRIGVNTGRAVVGNFGGKRRFDYTAHGDSINTAARLEAANKRLGTRICVSEATVAAVGTVEDLRFRPIGELALKGKSHRVRVFAPASADAAELSWSARYADAFACLARGEDAGAATILELFGLYPEDPILALHARRISAGECSTFITHEAA